MIGEIRSFFIILFFGRCWFIVLAFGQDSRTRLSSFRCLLSPEPELCHCEALFVSRNCIQFRIYFFFSFTGIMRYFRIMTEMCLESRLILVSGTAFHNTFPGSNDKIIILELFKLSLFYYTYFFIYTHFLQLII